MIQVMQAKMKNVRGPVGRRMPIRCGGPASSYSTLKKTGDAALSAGRAPDSMIRPNGAP
jgi:hypothetical protein